jgi:signal transduction histidine kinase
VNTVANSIIDVGCTLIEADAAAFWQYATIDECLRRVAVQGLPLDDAGPESLPLSAESPVTEAARSLTIQVIEEVPAGISSTPTGFAAALVVPLFVRDQLLGVLVLLSRRPRRFAEAEILVIQALAEHAAVVLDYASLATQQVPLDLRETFVSVASHELKTPLTSIKGYADLIARRLARDGQGERHQRAFGIIGQQMTDESGDQQPARVAHHESGLLTLEPQRLNLADFVLHFVDLWRPNAPNHQLAAVLPSQPVMVVADLERLGQALGNLLNNAVKHSPEESRITIRLEATTTEARIAVEDQGPGITSAARSLGTTTGCRGCPALGWALASSLPADRHPSWRCRQSRVPWSGTPFDLIRGEPAWRSCR